MDILWVVFAMCMQLCICVFVNNSYVPFLTLAPGCVARPVMFSRKHGVSPRGSQELKICPSSGEMAWSMCGQSSLASAALAASPFSLGSSNTQAHVREYRCRAMLDGLHAS